jgi:hypothetical protein
VPAQASREQLFLAQRIAAGTPADGCSGFDNLLTGITGSPEFLKAPYPRGDSLIWIDTPARHRGG